MEHSHFLFYLEIPGVRGEAIVVFGYSGGYAYTSISKNFTSSTFYFNYGAFG